MDLSQFQFDLPEARIALRPAEPQDAARLLVVHGDGRLEGIFTGRDFLHRIAAERRPPGDVRLAVVMTPEPGVVKRHYDVCYAINRMAVRAIRRLPVVDDEQRLVGILSTMDLLAALVGVAPHARSKAAAR